MKKGDMVHALAAVMVEGLDEEVAESDTSESDSEDGKDLMQEEWGGVTDGHAHVVEDSSHRYLSKCGSVGITTIAVNIAINLLTSE